jgi:hypothetical protein
MRISRFFVTTATAVITAAALAGCSGSGSAGSPAFLPSSSGLQSHVFSRDASGIAPNFLNDLRFGTVLPVARPDTSTALKFLAVTDFGTGATEILTPTYHLKSTITTGMNGPDGDWYDANGSLYVANYTGINVEEYKAGTKTPSFTYSTSLVDPVGVTTDESRHVYVADYNFGGAGFINEYKQGSNVVLHTCAPGGAAEGIATTETGGVFVSYNNSSGTGNIAEYPTGLAGCHEKVLGVALNFAGGLQLDNKNNLVACDQTAPAIDIIKKPYTSVSSTITGFTDPFHVALNESNSHVYVADPGASDVVVDKYPSGTAVTTLGSANGLSDPAGVATTPYQH